MAYRKFDDATKTVSQSPRKVTEAFNFEKERRALAGVLNRVIMGGTGGTQYLTLVTGCGTGASGTGISCTGAVQVIINGRQYARGTGGNWTLPAGTQGMFTVCKYLISGYGAGTSGTITAGNEAAGTNATAARLPDLPDGHVALGYMQYQAHTTSGWNRNANIVSGQGTGSSGTATFVDLIHMPYSEE